MATDLETAPGAKIPEPPPPAGHKRRFSLPSAYTILFALIVVTALATWIIPAGRYALDPNGSPMPGTYHEVDSSPARILVDSLKAPINGLYGIEDPATGNVDFYNKGSLFGAIDVALFILVIGGFIAVTMKTGAKTGNVVGALTVRDSDEIMLITTKGQMVRTRVKEIRETGRNTMGVKLMGLRTGEKLQAIAPVVSQAAEEEEVQSAEAETPEKPGKPEKK